MHKRALPQTVLIVGVLGALPLVTAAGPESPPPAAEILIAAVSDEGELTAILNSHPEAEEPREHVEKQRAEGPHDARHDSRGSKSEAQHDTREAQQDANDARDSAREAQEDVIEAEQQSGSKTGGHHPGEPEQKTGARSER